MALREADGGRVELRRNGLRTAIVLALVLLAVFGLFIAFPFMVGASLLFFVFPFIMDKIDVSSVGPPPGSAAQKKDLPAPCGPHSTKHTLPSSECDSSTSSFHGGATARVEATSASLSTRIAPVHAKSRAPRALRRELRDKIDD